MSKVIEFNYNHEGDIVTLICKVYESVDPYCTGDSPTQLVVDDLNIITLDKHGKPFDYFIFDSYHMKQIERIACDKYRGY